MTKAKSNSPGRPYASHKCPDGFVSAKEAASILKVHRVTVLNWQKRKLIPSYKLGHFVYFKPDELLAAIQKVV